MFDYNLRAIIVHINLSSVVVKGRSMLSCYCWIGFSFSKTNIARDEKSTISLATFEYNSTVPDCSYFTVGVYLSSISNTPMPSKSFDTYMGLRVTGSYITRPVYTSSRDGRKAARLWTFCEHLLAIPMYSSPAPANAMRTVKKRIYVVHIINYSKFYCLFLTCPHVLYLSSSTSHELDTFPCYPILQLYSLISS